MEKYLRLVAIAIVFFANPSTNLCSYRQVDHIFLYLSPRMLISQLTESVIIMTNLAF